MQLRNGKHGYGVVTKALHWITVAVLAAQFFVGYQMEDDPALERAKDRLDELQEGCEAESAAGEAGEEQCEEQLERQEDELDAQEDEFVRDALSGLFSGDGFGDGLSLPEWHVLLGLLIIAVGVLRVLWRRMTPLPPWADALSTGERKLEANLEKVLLALLFLVPGSGLLLVAGVGSLTFHIAAHIVFFCTVGLHIGLVLLHTVINRDRLLNRML